MLAFGPIGDMAWGAICALLLGETFINAKSDNGTDQLPDGPDPATNTGLLHPADISTSHPAALAATRLKMSFGESTKLKLMSLFAENMIDAVVAELGGSESSEG